ncbi:MAG: aminomethyl-transferring glycine dehydrogenase subunit GcvPA [Syntrophales bacterium]|jgi:glycine dehydrogenase subunit 1|nr:aminomethyl-transferring glycine dehydrogenase subunit GcvPA [Syntrophales bacterium]
MIYTPHTSGDTADMLKTIGVASVDDLFQDIPETCRLSELPDLPRALSEQEAWRYMLDLSGQNTVPTMTLMGAGAYHHYIPAVVGHIIGRAEFYTAYTPYQAEISQGILQAIYEYQTMIARLTGLPVSNASMYDGASAMAEGVVLAGKTTNRDNILISRTVHPEYRQVVATYCAANDYTLVEIPYDVSGRVDTHALTDTIDERTAAVCVQSPNFFGIIEDFQAIEPVTHSTGALLIAAFTDATSLGLLKPAGAWGADIVCGEGQSFGNPLNYGGPYLGIFAASGKLLRKIPGRLSGMTVDQDGNRGFVLTLQGREQHIRREKATSNICTNEALCALAASVYLVSLGKNLKKLSELNVYKAMYLKGRLAALPGWETPFPSPCYNEFVLNCRDPDQVNTAWREAGIIGGYALAHDYPELPNGLVLCGTEMLSKKDIDQAVGIAAQLS